MARLSSLVRSMNKIGFLFIVIKNLLRISRIKTSIIYLDNRSLDPKKNMWNSTRFKLLVANTSVQMQ